jgi:hypothetical protein
MAVFCHSFRAAKLEFDESSRDFGVRVPISAIPASQNAAIERANAYRE